jgi:hypothetical protein
VLRLYDRIDDDFLFVGTGNDKSRATSLGTKLTAKRNAVIGGYRLSSSRHPGSNQYRLSPTGNGHTNMP